LQDRRHRQPTEAADVKGVSAIRRTLEPIEKAAAKERMSEGGKGGKVSHGSGDSEGKERARDKIGAFAGVSGSQRRPAGAERRGTALAGGGVEPLGSPLVRFPRGG
jgi:hypothetical protein